MSGWNDGGKFGFDKASEDIDFCTDPRGVVHAIARNGLELRHYMRGSKNPFPWEAEGRVIPGQYVGSGSIKIWKDGNLFIVWPRADGDNQTYWENPLNFKDPSVGAVVPLDPKLRVSEMVSRFGYPILICPTLIPAYGIEKSLDEDLFCERYLNRGAEGGHFNAMRFFSFGVWENFTFNRVIFPYNKRGNRFDCFSRNPEWIETLDRRIGQCVERGYTVILTLIDNCSLHKKAGGWWNLHPWNGNKNINGSSTWNDSIYHFYEDEHSSKPGMKVTAKIIEEHIRFLVQKLDAKYKPNITWEICNESHAGNGWHVIMRDWLREEGVTDNWRVMTSMDGVEHKPGEFPYLTFYKKQMYKYLNYACHKVQTVDQYNWMKQWMKNSSVKFQASEDGLKPIGASNYRAFVKAILEDGNYGFESNIRPWWYGNVFDPDLFDWAAIEAIGQGWKDFLNS